MHSLHAGLGHRALSVYIISHIVIMGFYVVIMTLDKGWFQHLEGCLTNDLDFDGTREYVVVVCSFMLRSHALEGAMCTRNSGRQLLMRR